MSIRIKFCGLRSPGEAEAALAAGADLIGLNFVPSSPRCIEVEAARQIAEAVEGRVERVALFQNANRAQVREVLAAVPVERVQFHGDEAPEFVAAFGLPTIKALAGADRSKARSYPESIILVDHPSGAAGRGERWDWSEARELLREGFSIILAGGLAPENVADALAALAPEQPWGVDVASGIEVEGEKDLGRMKAFVEAVRRTERIS